MDNGPTGAITSGRYEIVSSSLFSTAIVWFRVNLTMLYAPPKIFGMPDSMEIEASASSSFQSLQSPLMAGHIEFITLRQSKRVSKHESDFDYEAPDPMPEYESGIFNDVHTIIREVAGLNIPKVTTAADMVIQGTLRRNIDYEAVFKHLVEKLVCWFGYSSSSIHSRPHFQDDLYLVLGCLIPSRDGVENAFEFTPKVVTLSLHQYEAGFFPGTGKKESLGSGRGRYCTINMPYKAGITNKQFNFYFESVLYSLCEVFYPDVIVCQCGGDALSGDPIGGANITIEGYTAAVKHILALGKPVLFLGGGGYNKINTAKLWTSLTSTITNSPISNDIPEHKFFPLHGPSFELEVTPGLRKSDNSQAFLDSTIQNAFNNIEALGKQLGKTEKLG
ncbi:unnamed protein product, partial [Meganyctiphanes norvegica]